MTLRYGILTIGTWDSFFPSSCFSGQNGMLSATEQNLTYNHSFFFKRLTTIQLNIFYQSGVCVPIKLVFSFEKNMWFFQESIVFIRTKISKRGYFLTRLYKNYIYLLLPHGEFFLWLTLIIFWRIPFSF